MTGARMTHLPEPAWTVAVTLDGAEATQAWAARLARELRAGDLLILTGELGAGKTTFTQGLGAGLGVREGIISPTFVLSRIHPSERLAADGDAGGDAAGEPGPDLVHVDAYRLGSAGELLDLDLDATVDHSVTVVEWGRGMAEVLAGWPEDPDASWLDLELRRATGAAGHVDPEPGGTGTTGEPGESAGTGADAGSGGAGVGHGFETDFSDEDGTGADEPRTAVLRGYGPRWGVLPIAMDATHS